jgi:hypothetical protein
MDTEDRETGVVVGQDAREVVLCTRVGLIGASKGPVALVTPPYQVIPLMELGRCFLQSCFGLLSRSRLREKVHESCGKCHKVMLPKTRFYPVLVSRYKSIVNRN